MRWYPYLSILTALFEIIFIILSINRKNGRKNVFYSAIGIIFFLMAYQITETLVCLDYGVFLSKLAFGFIVWLPALGLILISSLLGKSYKKTAILSKIFLTFAFVNFVLIFFTKDFVTSYICEVVWAKYTNSNFSYIIYSIYYETGLFMMIGFSLYGIINSDDKKKRLMLGYVLWGTLAFVIPALFSVVVVKTLSGALPSIMCHFAIILAIFMYKLLQREKK